MKPYKQTTKFTCAAAGLAMIINHFNPAFKLDQENEFDIWQRSAALPLRGSSIFGLALYAHEEGIPLKVIVGEPRFKFPGYRFKAYKKKEVELATLSSDFFLKKLKRAKVSVEKRDFDLKEVKQHLKQGKILLLRLIVGVIRRSKDNKRTSHYIPVVAFNNKQFELFDPQNGRLIVQEKIFKEAFEKVKDVKRDNRMILFG